MPEETSSSASQPEPAKAAEENNKTKLAEEESVEPASNSPATEVMADPEKQAEPVNGAGRLETETPEQPEPIAEIKPPLQGAQPQNSEAGQATEGQAQPEAEIKPEINQPETAEEIPAPADPEVEQPSFPTNQSAPAESEAESPAPAPTETPMQSKVEVPAPKEPAEQPMAPVQSAPTLQPEPGQIPPAPSKVEGPVLSEAEGFMSMFRNKLAEFRLQANQKRSRQVEENLNKILEYARAKQKITNDEVEKLIGVKDTQAVEYLNKLVEQGKLVRFGRTSNTFYSPRT